MNQIIKMINTAINSQTYLIKHENKIRNAANIIAQNFAIEYQNLLDQQDISEKVTRDLIIILTKQHYNTKLIDIELMNPSLFSATALNQLKISETIKSSIYNHDLSKIRPLIIL